MEALYDIVESIHVFLPLVAVIALILIVYVCGIGQTQQPDDSYIRNLERLDQSHPKAQAGAKPSAPKSPASAKSPKSPSAKDKKASPAAAPASTALRQRTVKKAPKAEKEAKEAEEEAAAANEGEWTTVTPKRRGQTALATQTAAVTPPGSPSTTPVKAASPPAPKTPSPKAKKAPKAPQAPPAEDREEETGAVEEVAYRPVPSSVASSLSTGFADAQKQIEDLMSAAGEAKKAEPKKSPSEGGDGEASTNGSYSITGTDSSLELLSPRLSGGEVEELVEEEDEDGVLIISRPSDQETPEEEGDAADRKAKKKKKKKGKEAAAVATAPSFDADDDGEVPQSPDGFTTVKKKSRPRRV